MREDLAKHAAGLSDEQVWRKIGGTSLGFHLNHIAGSVDRLTTYLTGARLTERQLDFLRAESAPGLDLSALLQGVEKSLSASEEMLRRIDPNSLYETRTVGRRALPTTVIGLIVHLAEHTQRHLGQAIIIAKLLRQTV